MKQPMKIYGYSLTNFNVEKSEKTKAKRGERQTKKIKKNRGGMNVRCGVYSKGGGGVGTTPTTRPRTERRATANYTYNLPKRSKTLQNALAREVKVNKDRSRGGLLLSKPLQVRYLAEYRCALFA